MSPGFNPDLYPQYFLFALFNEELLASMHHHIRWELRLEKDNIKNIEDSVKISLSKLKVPLYLGGFSKAYNSIGLGSENVIARLESVANSIGPDIIKKDITKMNEIFWRTVLTEIVFENHRHALALKGIEIIKDDNTLDEIDTLIEKSGMNLGDYIEQMWLLSKKYLINRLKEADIFQFADS